MKFYLVVVLVAVIAIAGCGSEDKKALPGSVGAKSTDDSGVNNAERKKSVPDQGAAGKKSAKEGEDGLLEGETSINPPGISTEDEEGE